MIESLSFQHEDLRVSLRMISYLCDVKSGLKKQLEQSTKLAQEHEALRARLATELEVAELKYQELLQTSTDERETALAVENSLREHYKQVLK
jgi:regulator of replication initiation timing